MKRHPCLAALLLVVTSHVALAQSSTPASLDRSQVIAAASDVMKQAHYCTLVTIGEEGQPQARVVDPSAPDQDLVVWLGTKNVTRKVAQLRKDPRATLLYFDRATLSYVTLLGSTTLVSDPVEKAKHWQPQWAPFYPEGFKSPDLLLIRFTPRSLEIVSGGHKLLNDPQSWRPVTVQLP